MQRTWKYRLYQTASQASELERRLAVACGLYKTASNSALGLAAWLRARLPDGRLVSNTQRVVGLESRRVEPVALPALLTSTSP